MFGRGKRERGAPGDRRAELKAAYDSASRAGDEHRTAAILREIVAEDPDTKWAWFDLGLYCKWVRNWEASRDCNLRALELFEAMGLPSDDPDGGPPEAWNLGIAATALGDWATARRAWAAYGIEIAGDPDEPILVNFGLTPIRVNPEPRFAEPELLIDGRPFATEVVWAQRLCPARARIVSVPFPGSGHRFGDVVLHDGDPVGERRLGDQVRSVFNEVALLERSPWPTLQTEISPVERADLEALEEVFRDSGYGAECWTTNVQVLCKACSEGKVGDQHDHPPGEEPARSTSYRVGLAAPAEEAERLLDEWARGANGRERGAIEQT